ncbi:MAG TPA: sigma-70 family RNA polymerase sigma factor [Pyrinomonadaceae bacterium]|nr:sigma-70 family RNA polymerase sigma factor [Pyrinomonadaceae bacterium]
MPSNIEQLLSEGTARLVARAAESRSLEAGAVLPRVRATLEKYLLRHQPDAAPKEVAAFLDALHADELLLVVACERGDDAAWNDLMTQYRSTVLSAARGASGNESEAEELAGSVWADLYGLRERADGQPAGKLAYYSGCGSLGGWLRAVVGQLAIDRHRRSSRLVQTEEASDFDRMVGDNSQADGWRPKASPNPERAFAESEAARAVQEALAQSIGELADEDRLLVKLYYMDGLRLREAGAVLGVHEATASRRLTRLHGEIRRRVESILVAGRNWTPEETARTLSEVADAHTETDLRAVLAAEASPGEQRDKVV